MRRLVAAALLLAMVARPGWGGPGTEFWAVLSENGFLDLSIVVTNPDAAFTASVVVESETGVVASATVPPLQGVDFVLPFDPRNAAGSVLARLAYRVCSDRPVHAYQMVPFDPTGTGAASILIDRGELGMEYIVLASGTAGPTPSVITIVAPGDARVAVTPAAAVQPGPGVPALPAGVTASFDLAAFDVLQLASEALMDLTGTAVVSNAPVEVFAGCRSCTISSSAADQVQDWMLPVPLWGTTAAAVTSYPKTLDTNRWRILASEDGTTVTTDPPQPGTPAVIDRGQYLELWAASDFHVTATKPVLVGRYTTGGPGGGEGGSDPSLCLMLPPERFGRAAIFDLPTDPIFVNWVDVVAKPGATVKVDGSVVPAADFVPIGSSGYSHAQVRLSNATRTHTVESDQPAGLYAGHACCAQAMSFPLDIGFPINLAPICDAGGPYSAPCAGITTTLAASGAGSSDPEGQPLQFLWSSSAPEVSFDDPTKATPLVTVSGIGSHPLDLRVSDGSRVSTCSTTVTTTGDTSTPPELDRFGTPMWLAKKGAQILFSWQDLGGAPMFYSVYEGPLKVFFSHVPLACNLGGTVAPGGRREAVLSVGAGSVYFQMTAANCAAEGPSGGDPLLSTCPP